MRVRTEITSTLEGNPDRLPQRQRLKMPRNFGCCRNADRRQTVIRRREASARDVVGAEIPIGQIRPCNMKESDGRLVCWYRQILSCAQTKLPRRVISSRDVMWASRPAANPHKNVAVWAKGSPSTTFPGSIPNHRLPFLSAFA